MSCKYTGKIGIAVVTIALVISNPLSFQNLALEQADAQSITLIVSAAKDPAQENHFFGPQIVQIIIDDPGARNPDTSTSGLSVNGVATQRVHLADGLWYTFLAEEDSFLLFLDVMTDGSRNQIISVSDSDDSDNSNSIGSINIQFGNSDSFVREITEVGGSIFVEVKKDAIFPSLPSPFTGAAINPDLDVNPSAELAAGTDWPYVRLFNIQENDILDITHGVTIVSLTFSSLLSSIEMDLDRASYPTNSEIIVSFKDFMWNINPVEEDVVTFVLDGSTGNPTRIIYQPLRDFNPDPATSENFPDLLPEFANLEFDARQLLEVDAPEGINAIKFIEIFDRSDDRVVTFAAEPFIREAANSRSVSEFTSTGLPIYAAGAQVGTSATDDLPVVTFTESDPNTSLFETIDEGAGSRSNVFAAVNDRVASFDYFDIIRAAAIGLQDAYVNVEKEVYDSGDRTAFSVIDLDLNERTNVSEDLDGIESKAFVMVGSPFPLTNNAVFNTLPGSGGNFLASSIKGADFQLGSCPGTVVEIVDFDAGASDLLACDSDIEDLAPTSTDFLALDFTTSAVGPTMDLPTGFIVSSDVRLADIDDVISFRMTKAELLSSTDPFIRSVSDLLPSGGGSFEAAGPGDEISVTFPKFNLIHLDLQRLGATFSKVFVELSAFDGNSEVGSPQIIDFEPFDPEDLDGDTIFEPDPLIGDSGIGSFRVLEIIDSLPAGTNINSVSLRFTVVVTDSSNNPLDLASQRHQAVMDVTGIGVVRSEGTDKDDIDLDAFENFVYRLGLDEESEDSSEFTGSVDFMTVLHGDTVQGILQTIVPTGDPLRIWLPNRFVPPNRLAFSYTDTDVTGIIRQVSATFTYETRDPQVSWDRAQYRFNQVAMLTVTDDDLNRRPDAIEQYTIPQDGFLSFEFDGRRADTTCTVGTPDCFANKVEARLRETGPDTGVFKAQITMPERVLLQDGSVIKTIKSDIEANYIDARDSSSNVGEFAATASIRSEIDTTVVPPEPSPEGPAAAEKGSTRLELDKGNYHPFERVTITITSPEANTDLFRTDVIFISVKRQFSAIGITSYKLVETGADTGVFAGYIDLQGRSGKDGGVGPRDGTLGMDAGDSLVVSYAGVEAIAPIRYHEGMIFWDKTKYAAGERARLDVTDRDMNTDSDRIETLTAQLLIDNTKMQIDLRETDLDTGIFVVEVTLVEINVIAKPGELRVKPGDTITAVYNDETAPPSSIQAAGLVGDVLPVNASATISSVLELQGTSRIVQKESRLVDEGGVEVSSAKSRHSYRVESMVYNNTTQAFTFEFIVQVKDRQGVTRFLEFVTQSVEPEESITPAVGWQPTRGVEYVIEIFVWQNLEMPSALSSVSKMSVTVERDY